MPLSPERRDSAVYLVLSILEGHGFGFLQSPVVIVASACGIYLDTEVVPASPDPVFHMDLVWETNKKSLRRFRASNTPIKLECFTVGANGKRTCIGTILLNIKSAQVVSNESDTKVCERWYKLIGVPAEAKALQPELLLSLKIQETVAMSRCSPQSPQPGHYTMKECPKSPRKSPVFESADKRKTVLPLPTDSQESFTPFYNDVEQYIQIGPKNSSQNLFVLTLNIGDIVGISTLVSLKDTGSTTTNDGQGFQILFTIMNKNFSSKVFDSNGVNDVFHVNEAIIIRLQTSLHALYMYLHENPSLPVHLLWRREELAAAELHLRSLVPTDNTQSFANEFGGEISCSQRCLWVSSRSGSIPIHDGTQPFVEVTSKLQLVNVISPIHKKPSSALNEVSSESPAQQIPSAFNEVSSESSAQQTHTSGGELIPSRSESRQSQETFILSAQSGPKWVPVAPTLTQAQSLVLRTGCFNKETKGNHLDLKNRLHTVSIKLSKLILKRPPQSHCLRIMFECSQKPILTTDFPDIAIESDLVPIALNGICARIDLSSSMNEMEGDPSIEVILSEVNADPSITEPFASGNIQVTLHDIYEKKQCSLCIPLQCTKTHQEIGLLQGMIVLEYMDHFHLPESTAKHEAAVNNLQQTAPNNLQQYEESAVRKNVKFLTSQNLSSFTECEEMFVNGGKTLSGLWHAQSNELQIISVPPQIPPSIAQSVRTALSPPLTDTHPPNIHPPPVPPPRLDSDTAYQIVEELEDWKEKQQELFQAELKRKESDHLSQVSEELIVKRKELESVIGGKIEECKSLAQSLSNAREDLKNRLKKCLQREQELQKEKEELEHQYNMKFQELVLTAKRLDEGAKLKVSLAELKCSQLEERLITMESENESLRQQLRQKLSSNPHGDSHTCGMSHNQVTKLLNQVNQLEEKLQASLKSKAYFKEQWGRAVREMNQARSQFSQIPEKHGIAIILGKEEAELHHDKKALEELRKELANYKYNQTS